MSRMMLWRYCVGIKADIHKCHTHADAYWARFHSRHNRLKVTPPLAVVRRRQRFHSGEAREC
jgi:hypothetical protein